MGAELVTAIALCGAAVCWVALAAPELPAMRRAVARRLRQALRIDRIAADLAQAEIRWISPWRWLAARWGVAAIAGAAGYLAFGLLIIGLVAALAAHHLMALGLEARRRQVEARRQRALLDAIRFGVAVMARSGGALQMLRALAAGGPVDAQPIFRELLAEAGSDQSNQLVGAVARVRASLADPLFDDIALALILHWTQGGRLVPALEALAASWDETLRMQRDAKALRAGMEASVALLTVLPFVFLFLIHLLAPALLDPLGQPLGEVVLAVAVGWMVTGYRVLQRLSEAPREERLSLQEVRL
jgi:Flp pilus assembly protein TadB